MHRKTNSYRTIFSVSLPLVLSMAATTYFIFTGVLKGAGDTRFIMWSIGIITLVIMIFPVTVGVAFLGWGLYACWVILTLYVIALCSASFFRYSQGKWKIIRVIEKFPV